MDKKELVGKKAKLKKEYFFSVVEEMIMNPDFYGVRAGRIEIYDPDEQYPIDEIRFILPEEIYEDFREAIDFKKTNVKFYLGEINSNKYEKK